MRMIERFGALLLVSVCFTILACGGGESGESNGESSLEGDIVADSSESDAGFVPDVVDADTTIAEDVLSDATSSDDAWVDQVSTPDVVEKPWPPEVAPEAALELVDMGEWWVATVPYFNSEDKVGAAIADGTFEVPTDKGFYLDAFWKGYTQTEDGHFDSVSGGVFLYAVKTWVVEEETTLVVQAERITDIRIGSLRQPGDVYASGRHRVAFVVPPGEHQVIVRCMGGGAQPKANFWTTTDELVFNFEDHLPPSLLSGETGKFSYGVPLLNLTNHSAVSLTARVEENDFLEASELTQHGLPPGASTQVAFELIPKGAWPEAGTAIPVTFHVESPSMYWAYERTIELTTEDGGPEITGAFQRTFISDMDGSVQFYGERRPANVDSEMSYGVALSLHGASVNAKGQANSYSSKDWAYVIAATNRRPFGFDWQAWGRRDAIEVLETAMERYNIDPTRVHLTGHSMGGHGTWHIGTLFTGRFAVIGPSAGWINFETYGGANPSTGPFGWAENHFDPRDFVDNLTHKGVYLIHGTADDNVPIWHADTMFGILEPFVTDLYYHQEEGAGHWWNGDVAEGVDCVDWTPLFDLMEERTVDPFELNFQFTAPAPWVNPDYSYVKIMSQETPAELSMLVSSVEDGVVTLDTDNVRSMQLDGDALVGKGVTSIVVNGNAMDVSEGVMEVGPQEGKNPTQMGPLNQAMHAPWCWIYPDEGSETYRRYASYLASDWNVIGNGRACAVAWSELNDEIRASFNLIYLGIPRADVPVPENMPFTWDDSAVVVAGQSYSPAMVAFVFPEGDKLSAVYTATGGSEELLFAIQPYTSRFVIPDYLVYTPSGTAKTGFFDADWNYSAGFSAP